MSGNERKRPERQGIGRPVRRKEDARLIIGKVQYGSYQFPDRRAHAALSRSPHAHARSLRIDVSAARSLRGVIDVSTGADLLADGVKPIPHGPNWVGMPDVTLRFDPNFKVFTTDHIAMPAEIVRHVGEPIAMVVAESLAIAREAADLIKIEWDNYI